MRKQPIFACEQVSDTTRLVVSGQAQSVYDLYRKMVLGTVDAQSYLRPAEFEDNPNLDDISPVNSFGMTLEEFSDARTAAEQQVSAEVARQKAEKEKKKKEELQATTTPPPTTPPTTPPTE